MRTFGVVALITGVAALLCIGFLDVALKLLSRDICVAPSWPNEEDAPESSDETSLA